MVADYQYGFMLSIAVVLLILILILVFRIMERLKTQEQKIDALLTHSKRTEKQNLASQRTPQPITETPQGTETVTQQSTPVTPVSPRPVDSVPAQPRAVPSAQPPIYAEVSTPISPAKEASQPKLLRAVQPSFLERNPDLEKFIGENLLSKIGIVIFVIGMGFLIKLGVDSGVIKEPLRVVIGVVIGGGLIGLAHYLRKSFQTFSSVLIGGGLSVLYFTIALAFHEYGLISQTAAFIIMVFITAMAVVLSLAYDRKELAVLAIIGGFGTPFFLSTGEGNIAVLFTYILILDIGMLALVYFKKWNIVNYLAYGFTYILVISVFITKYLGNEEETRTTIFLFLTCFYVLFFLMNIVYNIRKSKNFKYSEVIILLSNSAIYFVIGLAITQEYRAGIFAGAFTALVALFNFIFALALYRKSGIDKNLLFLLIGLVLTFLSLIAPIQLDGNHITLFWAIEAVLLFWLAQKSKIKLLKATSLVVATLMLVSLFIDWQQNYAPIGAYVELKFFLNKVFITSVVGLLSLLGLNYLMDEKELISIKRINIVWRKVVVRMAFAIVLFLAFYLELNYQFIRFEFANNLRSILLGIYVYCFLIGLISLRHAKPGMLLSKVVMGYSAISVLLYITWFLGSTSEAVQLLADGQDSVSNGFYWHFLLLALFVFILFDLSKSFFLMHDPNSNSGKIGLWMLAFIGVVVCTAEAGHLSVWYQASGGVGSGVAYGVAVKSIFPIVWALFALVLMVIGMKFRLKSLRIASLILFTITILKLFIYDLRGNSTGKIVSFILLGVILLVISFLYQKLKFIIQDDQKEPS